MNSIVTAQSPTKDLGPFGFFQSGWRNRKLILRLAKREIEARYRGSLLGIFWTVLVPVIMLLVYGFTFTVVFQAKWEIPAGGKGHFVLLLFSGLIIFNLFSECLNRAPGLLLQHASYIKKVVFPLEILPWVTLIVALFNAATSSVILAIVYAVLLGVPPITAVYLPLMLLPILFLSLGLTLFFSSVGVFVRDLQQLMGLITMVIMFLSPLFYPISALPERYRTYIKFSPISLAIEESRKVLFLGQSPDFVVWGIYLACSWLVAWVGFIWFMKTKKGFADVV
jgi:lipopolysaccharide transport system permease protein